MAGTPSRRSGNANRHHLLFKTNRVPDPLIRRCGSERRRACSIARRMVEKARDGTFSPRRRRSRRNRGRATSCLHGRRLRGNPAHRRRRSHQRHRLCEMARCNGFPTYRPLPGGDPACAQPRTHEFLATSASIAELAADEQGPRSSTRPSTASAWAKSYCSRMSSSGPEDAARTLLEAYSMKSVRSAIAGIPRSIFLDTSSAMPL